MASVDFTIEENNLPQTKEALDAAVERALVIIGMNAEKYAKALCPVGTPESTGKPGYIGGTLRNSITNQLEGDDTVAIGSNVHYAPYVELGTRKMTARPYLRPAIEDHVDEFKNIIESELKNG